MNRAGLAALLAASVLAGCGAFDASTPAPSVAYGAGRDLQSPEIGVAYDYDVMTHCGFWGLTFGGVVWVPEDGPEVARQDDNFDFLVDHGTVVITDEDHAAYTSSTGFEVQLKPWDGVVPSNYPGGCM